MENKRKKVVLMCQQGVPYETSPARYQLVHELKKRGYKIYVFNLGKIIFQENRDDIDYFVNTKSLSQIEIGKKIKNIMPDYLIASTDDDVRIIFPFLREMKSTSFIYYNLEIFTPKREMGRHRNKRFYPIIWRKEYLINKTKEIIFTRRCRLFTIQDSLREKISEKYLIGHPNTMLIPNSYIYDKNNCIGNDRCGVIYSGILTRFRMEPLMSELRNMPDFPIVFSGKSDEWSRKEFERLHSMHPGVELHEQSLSPDQHLEYIKQYAVGLVWYDRSEDDNEQYIGLASGKLFRHLSIEQPVIVSKCPGVAKVVSKYKLGIVINSMSEVAEAYQKIMDNYHDYQNNIRRVYRNKFDYAKNIQPFLSEMEKM